MIRATSFLVLKDILILRTEKEKKFICLVTQQYAGTLKKYFMFFLSNLLKIIKVRRLPQFLLSYLKRLYF